MKSFQNKYTKLEDDLNQKLNREKVEHDKNVYLIEREKDLYVDRNIKGEGTEAQKNILRDHYVRRLDNLKKQMADQTVKYQRDATELDKSVQNELRNRELDNRKIFDKREDSFHKELTSLERKTKENDDKRASSYREKLRSLEGESIKKIAFEKDDGKQKLDNQRKDFSKTMNKINDINSKNIEILQSNSSIEKKEIIETSKKEMNQVITDVRDEYRKKHDKVTESYDQRLNLANDILEKVKNESEEKIDTIQRHANSKVQQEMQYNRETRDADRKLMLDQLANLKRDYDIKFRTVKKDFDQELSKVKKENDLMLQRLTKKNEEEKNLLATDNSRSLKKATNDFRDELKKTVTNSKIEKEALIDNYERKIQDLKSNYDLDKLKVSDEKRQNNA